MPPLIVKTALKCRYGLQNESKYLDINIPASHLHFIYSYIRAVNCVIVLHFSSRGFNNIERHKHWFFNTLKLMFVIQAQVAECNGSVRNNRGGWSHAGLTSQYDDPLLSFAFLYKSIFNVLDLQFPLIIIYSVVILNLCDIFSPSLNQSLVTKAIVWQRV